MLIMTKIGVERKTYMRTDRQVSYRGAPLLKDGLKNINNLYFFLFN